MNLLRWICFSLAIYWAASEVVHAQTIADAARGERERRKAVESETSESIPVVASGTPSPSASSTLTTRVKTAAANEKPKNTGPTDFQGHDEKYWRPKFDAARLAVKHAEDHLEMLDQKLANQNPTLVNGRSNIALQRATHERDVARKALADAQQKVSDLEDQLRRSGGLPGWSRPR